MSNKLSRFSENRNTLPPYGGIREIFRRKSKGKIWCRRSERRTPKFSVPCKTRKDVIELQFFMPMIPPTVTHQEKKTTVNKNTGKVIYYEPVELKDARAKLTAALHPHRPAEPFDTALHLQTSWLFPSDEKHPPNAWKTTKPDTDNLQKLLKDIMTQLGYWKDDALVCSELITKTYSKQPGIFIEIRPLKGV